MSSPGSTDPMEQFGYLLDLDPPLEESGAEWIEELEHRKLEEGADGIHDIPAKEFKLHLVSVICPCRPGLSYSADGESVYYHYKENEA